MLNPSKIIELLDLEPLPVEGGYFRQSYLSTEMISQSSLPVRYKTDKPFGSTIYYLLYNDLFSALHRLPTDEIYHHYLGDPVEMLLLAPDGNSQTVVLGPDLVAGQNVQFVAPAGSWQGSHVQSSGSWALMGTTMAPAYGPEDFELGSRTALSQQYPDVRGLIEALTNE